MKCDGWFNWVRLDVREPELLEVICCWRFRWLLRIYMPSIKKKKSFNPAWRSRFKADVTASLSLSVISFLFFQIENSSCVLKHSHSHYCIGPCTTLDLKNVLHTQHQHQTHKNPSGYYNIIFTLESNMQIDSIYRNVHIELLPFSCVLFSPLFYFNFIWRHWMLSTLVSWKRKKETKKIRSKKQVMKLSELDAGNERKYTKRAAHTQHTTRRICCHWRAKRRSPHVHWNAEFFKNYIYHSARNRRECI